MRQIQRWSARLVVCDAAAPDPSTSAAIIPSRASFDLGCQARIVSSRKKRRGREAEDRTLPEELFGLAWARLLRVGVPVFSLVLLVGGCFVFVVWSQVMGQLLLAAGLGLGLMWFVLRRGDPKGALAALRRRRRPLIAIGFGLIAAGAALFALVDQDLGLLLVVLGAAALTVTLIGAEQEPMASPMDGPMFGDTPPYGD